MKITPSSSEAVLQELAAWSALAHDALESTMQPLETNGMRALKQHLLRQHSIHLTQLRKWLGKRRIRRFSGQQRNAWSQVIEAMESRDEHVALAACALLERAVLAAYEMAADRFWLESKAMRLVRRQKIELKCCRDHYLRRVQSWQEDDARTPPEGRLAFGGLAPAVS